MADGQDLIIGRNNAGDNTTRLTRDGAAANIAQEVINANGSCILGRSGAGSRFSSLTNPSGVWGDSASGWGVWGTSNRREGVRGDSFESVGVRGNSNEGDGVIGQSNQQAGVVGFSTNYDGVQGYRSE